MPYNSKYATQAWISSFHLDAQKYSSVFGFFWCFFSDFITLHRNAPVTWHSLPQLHIQMTDNSHYISES